QHPPGLTIPALAAGLFALIILSFSTQLRWVYVSYSSKEPSRSRSGSGPSEDERNAARANATSDTLTLLVSGPVGLHLLFYSAGIALLALATLTLSQLLSREQADAIIVSTSSLAVGWGVAAGMWLLGYCWKIITMWIDVREGITIFPNFGLMIGLLAA